MKRLTILICAVFATLVIAVTSSATPIWVPGVTETSGWIDTEKTGTDDSWLCWAASSANILQYTGWVGAPKLSTAAEIFADYKWFWNDNVGNPLYGVEWWFDGINKLQVKDPKEIPKGAQLTNTTHTGFYSTQLFEDNRGYQKLGNETFETQISNYVGNKMGISLAFGLYSSNDQKVGGHSLTLWGIDVDNNEIFVTDSDDKNLNTLSTYKYDDTRKLDLDDPTSTVIARMDEIFGLKPISNYDPKPKPTPRPVPEPSTMLLLGIGLAGFIWVGGKFRSR